MLINQKNEVVPPIMGRQLLRMGQKNVTFSCDSSSTRPKYTQDKTSWKDNQKKNFTNPTFPMTYDHMWNRR